MVTWFMLPRHLSYSYIDYVHINYFHRPLLGLLTMSPLTTQWRSVLSVTSSHICLAFTGSTPTVPGADIPSWPSAHSTTYRPLSWYVSKPGKSTPSFGWAFVPPSPFLFLYFCFIFRLRYVYICYSDTLCTYSWGSGTFSMKCVKLFRMQIIQLCVYMFDIL